MGISNAGRHNLPVVIRILCDVHRTLLQSLLAIRMRTQDMLKATPATAPPLLLAPLPPS